MFKNFVFILILIFACFFQGAYSQTYEARINETAPALNAAKVGGILNELCKIHNGGDVLATTPVIALGSTDSTDMEFTNTLYSWFDGVLNTTTTQEEAFTATTHDVADGKFASFQYSLASNDATTLTVSAATYATFDSAVTALAAVPSGQVSIGYVVIGADGALFNATTTRLDASTVNYWFVPATVYIKDLD